MPENPPSESTSSMPFSHPLHSHQVSQRASGAMVKTTETCTGSPVLLFQVCLGAEAEDKFHVVEMEGLTYDGKSTKVPLVVLKLSVLPSVSN